MKTTIHTLKFAINRCYIIQQKGTIMVDSGPAKSFERFQKYLKQFSISPGEIGMIALTHGDFDHVGSAREIKEYTCATIAIHEKDKENLEEGKFNWPPGTNAKGKIIRSVFFPLMKRITFPPVNADITFSNSEFPLYDFGIQGKILYTPGHTDGSISLLLDSGEAFVGCLAHNGFPFRRKPNLPIFADNVEKIKKSWKMIIEKGAKTIYPAHGNPFRVEEIKKYLS